MSSNRGYSLVELMVAMGLLGLFFIGFNEVSRYVIKLNKKIELSGKSSEVLTELKKEVNKIHQNISWIFFDYDKTYYKASSDNRSSLVTWKFPRVKEYLPNGNRDDLAMDFQGEIFYRNSYTLEIPAVKSSKGSHLLLSRCLERNRNPSSLDLSEVKALDYVPFIRPWSKTHEIHCCPIGGKDDCSNAITRAGNYKVVTFYFKRDQKSSSEVDIKYYPGDGDKKVLDSVGLVLNFNKDDDPNQYTVTIFALIDPCLGEKNNPTCRNQRFIFNSLKTDGDVKSKGIRDRGFIQF